LFHETNDGCIKNGAIVLKEFGGACGEFSIDVHVVFDCDGNAGHFAKWLIVGTLSGQALLLFSMALTSSVERNALIFGSKVLMRFRKCSAIAVALISPFKKHRAMQWLTGDGCSCFDYS